MELATSLAMKIASPNDTNPDCIAESGVTYGVANRYASSTGDDSGKIVDTFNGNVGEKDEINTNTSCATLSMSPNTYDSTYSDVTVYTNSGTGYAVSVRSADNTSPNLVNILDSTLSIPAGTLTESDNTVSGGQNTWSYKTDNGIITNWSPMSNTDTTIKAYDQETNGGETTRVTYGISAGSNPTGKYATALIYTATMFDGANPYVSKLNVTASDNLTISTDSLSIPFGQSAEVTATPAAGYYLSSVTCPEGFTCSGYEINPADTSAQTVTVTNGDSENTGTISLTASAASLSSLCSGKNSGDVFDYQNVTYIKLADNHCWTKNNRGTVQQTAAANLCPTNTHIPSNSEYTSLINSYGGDNGNLYKATSWSGRYWSTYRNTWNHSTLTVSNSRAYIYTTACTPGNGECLVQSFQTICMSDNMSN